MFTNRDMFLAIKEMVERHWDVYEIAVKLKVDVQIVQAVIDLLT